MHMDRAVPLSRTMLSERFLSLPQFMKLEMAMTFALFVTRFGFEAVDGDGKKLDGSRPLESRNFQLQKSDICLKYKAIA